MRAHRVRALLMGGQACVFYGAAEFSRDTDLAILADAANLARRTGSTGSRWSRSSGCFAGGGEPITPARRVQAFRTRTHPAALRAVRRAASTVFPVASATPMRR